MESALQRLGILYLQGAMLAELFIEGTLDAKSWPAQIVHRKLS